MADQIPGAPSPVIPVPTYHPLPESAPEAEMPDYHQPAYDQRAIPAAQPVAVAAAPAAATPVLQAAPRTLAPAVEQTPGYAPEAYPSITLVEHSPLFYWWPVWAVGYACALITYLEGSNVQFGPNSVNIHASNNLGVFFFLTLFIVIMISNVVVRGLASFIVILSIITLTILFAYLGWWDAILNWFGELTIFLNQGAYFWFSTLMFTVWVATTFIFDRMSYWRVRPGQIVHMVVFGGAERSYDTENMTFAKERNDFFRHWLLGLGSGDLTIHAFNAGQPTTVHIHNVLFIGMKIRAVQQLIAMKATDAAI